MDIKAFLQHVKDTVAQVQQKAATTPVSPLGVTPQQMMNFQAPLEQQVNTMNPLLRSALGPITQVPGFVGENVRQAGRFAGLQPNTMDVATAPLMFLGGIKNVGKAGTKIDDVMDIIVKENKKGIQPGMYPNLSKADASNWIAYFNEKKIPIEISRRTPNPAYPITKVPPSTGGEIGKEAGLLKKLMDAKLTQY